MKIRTKTGLLIGISSLITMAFTIGLWVNYELVYIRRNQRENILASARVVVETIRAAVDFGDTETLDKGIKNLLINPAIHGVSVNPPGNGSKPLAGYFRSNLDPDVHPLSENITKDGKVIGILHVWVSDDEIDRAINNYLKKLLLIALLVLAITAIVASMMQRFISKPLMRLARLLKTFQGGDYHVRAPIADREDEIGDLARGFNSMAEKIGAHIDDLNDRALHDHLTGLKNRHYMDDAIIREMMRASRSKLSLSVIMADIDHFKQINDKHGHDAGDIALKTIAGIFSGSLRDIDILARWGGEEFLFLLPYTNLDAAMGKAEQLREKIEQHIFEGTGVKHITCSFGVAACRCGIDDRETLLKRADVGLYMAKKQRNKVVAE